VKITIVGATGGVGRHLLEQSVAAGHDVTAVVRRAGLLSVDVPTVVCDLAHADPAELASAVAGADGVLSALGRRSTADAGIATRGTTAIVEAMHRADTRRLVVISATPVGTVASAGRPNPPRRDPGDGLLIGTLLMPLAKAAFGANYADLAQMEDVVRDSGLDWTIVRPPRLTDSPLTDSPLTGRYRLAYEQNLRRGLTVSRSDLAHFMLLSLNLPDAVRRTVRIAR
jgi:putative NADH-flavin reductase